MTDAVPTTKPPCELADAMFVLQTLRSAGHATYFAGGCVRDILLGEEPKDYDVATDATPEKVKSLFRNAQLVGEAFGVILVRTGGSTVEVATFRADGKYLDRRRPSEVRFTTPEEDARRRDFTINGMFLDPIENRVLDFVGGQQDLKDRTLRAIGNPDDRFEEDHLRLLRAVRFAARLKFNIEPKTRSAITQRSTYLKSISPERVGDELKRMLTTSTRKIAYAKLNELELTPVLMRCLNIAMPDISPAQFFTPENNLFEALDSNANIGFGMALAIFTLDYRIRYSRPNSWVQLLNIKTILDSVQACRKTFKISNVESDEMTGILSVIDLLADELPTMAMLKRFLAAPTSSMSRVLLNAMAEVDRGLKRVQWLNSQFSELDKIDCAPIALLNGDDLTAAGFKPGPIFKRILDTVYDAQLEGRVSDKSAAMKLGIEMATDR